MAADPVCIANTPEHSVEVARKALKEAAVIESGEWRDLLLRFARNLPDRSRTNGNPQPAVHALSPKDAA